MSLPSLMSVLVFSGAQGIKLACPNLYGFFATHLSFPFPPRIEWPGHGESTF
jgi:hypothetical protein